MRLVHEELGEHNCLFTDEYNDYIQRRDMEASNAFDQTPLGDSETEEVLSVLGLVHMKLETIAGLAESPRMLPEVLKLKQDVELLRAVKKAQLIRERTPED